MTIRKIVETDNLQFEISLSLAGRTVYVHWYNKVGTPLKVQGRLKRDENGSAYSEVVIDHLEMLEGSDFDQTCELLERQVMLEWGTIKDRLPTIGQRLSERFRERNKSSTSSVIED